MPFYPEKIDRPNIDNEDRHDIVLASDYDKLLSLYREERSRVLGEALKAVEN
jgi:hypothetical protein